MHVALRVHGGLSREPAPLPLGVDVLIPCGARLELLAFANARLTTVVPNFAQFTVQLTGGNDQKIRRRSAFLQLASPSKALAKHTSGAPGT